MVVSLAVGVALGALLGSWLVGDHGGLRLASDSSVVVRPGDTLWSIARSVSGSEDVRAVVDRIQQLNHLGGAPLRPGQVLQLP